EIPKMGVEIQQKLRSMSDAVEDVRAATAEVEKIGNDGNGTATREIQEVVVKPPTLLYSAFDTVAQLGATLAVTLILALFLLSSGQLFYLKLVQAMPTMTGKKRVLSTVY